MTLFACIYCIYTYIHLIYTSVNHFLQNFRPLQELDLIDNFLFQEMLSQGEDSETFARILLSTILEKPIRRVKITPQKPILGVDTNNHGIRMDAYIEDISDMEHSELSDAELIPDIYDIEPNKIFEQDTLPKRMRYYHGLIDTKLLSIGSDYDTLPNVVIIFILPYDPFHKNRMIYTVRNHCEEDASIPYDDGARKIFLYTKGTEGNPSQALQDMLKYIQKSTVDNVTNPDIASIQQLVDKVKQKPEVGINYMKSWEIEKMMRKEGYQDGFDDGFDDGFNDGATKMGQLILCLTDAGRTEDIPKVTNDIEYRKKLLEEFNL